MAKILICENERNAPAGLQPALAEKGHEVKVSGSLSEAVEIAADFKPEVLVADWSLDGMACGVDLADRIQKSCPGIVTLLCTALPEEAAAACDARRVPGITIVTRPFPAKSVVEKVSEVCPSGR